MSDFMRGLQAFERLVKSDEGVRTGSCGKCGGSGHLTYECRNMIKLDTPAAKPKASSRFGFLRKQLPATAGSPSTSATSTTLPPKGSDRKSSDSRSTKDTKSTSSSRPKKKRRSSVSSSTSSDSDSSSESESESSASSSESDSEEEELGMTARIGIATATVGPLGIGIVPGTGLGEAAVTPPAKTIAHIAVR
ncbi:hypothetical protein BGX33_004282 [Mortierella sp. NVP41]|nr:hypothetical protein BGX33_004282 [Mortierella sp. NVP41]